MNLPNKLTISRLGLTAVFVACLSISFHGQFTVAFLVFLIATLTDYFDGIIARQHALATDFGRLMDPLADKILTAAAFICLCELGKIPSWVVIIIISREFLITGLRSLAASKGIVLPAERLGKHKTAWQMITIIYFLLLLTITEWTATPWLVNAWLLGMYFLLPLTTALTIYSGLAYLVKNRDLFNIN